MKHYNVSISFPYSNEDKTFLNEYLNQDENSHELNPDSLIHFDNEDIYELNLDSHADFDISALFGTKDIFKVEFVLKYKSEKEINKIIQSKNIKKEIKEKLYLDESKSSKEIKQVWNELIFPYVHISYLCL